VHYLHELAVAAIMKDESPYLQEWLDFHLWAGVSHFYLYDNGSTDGTREILQPYIQQGCVTYKYRPAAGEQLPVYREVLQRYRFLCRYIAFIDLDEFLYAPEGGSLPETLQELVRDFGEPGGFTANWCCYGSSGAREAELSRGVLERFAWRAADGFPNDRHIKSIVNPRCAAYFATPHAPVYFLGKYAIDETGQRVEQWCNKRHPVSRLRINHYGVKSYAEWVQRRSRRCADTGGVVDRDIDAWFREFDRNDIQDQGILAYRQLRQDMPPKRDDQAAFVAQLVAAIQACLQEQQDVSVAEYLAYIQNAQLLFPAYLAEEELVALLLSLLAQLRQCLSREVLEPWTAQLCLDAAPLWLPVLPPVQREDWRRTLSQLATGLASAANQAYDTSCYYWYDYLAQLFRTGA